MSNLIHKLKEECPLTEGLRIIVNFDENHAAIGEAAGLLAGFDFASRRVIRSLNIFCSNHLVKSRDYRPKLWNEFHDPRFSKTQLIKNVPANIAADQWALYVEYRLKPETQKDETGKKVSRVEMWGITHKKKDGSYVNEQAKEIAEKIEAHCTQQSVDSTINSHLDALVVVLRKKHPGRVRGFGMGVVPTVSFQKNTTRISQMNLGSSNDVDTSSTCGSRVQEELEIVKAQLEALVSYIASKERGKLP
ncbi:hypothetical protein PIB30_016636 [Stylosanthes scabra]|uniref:Uncharacterized protein n=1 Tax=Stylosanthes scabra TaxID=79078 RepID=A0ABU6V6C4_9FABA|nr:hypothetical protein [Stylosanthes scabra]